MNETTIDKRLSALRYRAEEGNLESMFLLAIAHAQGKGVEQDDREAARWFHAASRRGHLRSKTSLGYLYSIGRGVRHDAILSYMFLDEASDEGDLLAPDILTKLCRLMSPPQLQEAKKRRNKLSE